MNSDDNKVDIFSYEINRDMDQCVSRVEILKNRYEKPIKNIFLRLFNDVLVTVPCHLRSSVKIFWHCRIYDGF